MNILILDFLNLSNPTIINTAPNPYIGQNGPYTKPFLLSSTPVVAKPNVVSTINPTILNITRYHIKLVM